MTERALTILTPEEVVRRLLEVIIAFNTIFRPVRMMAHRKQDGSVSIGWVSKEMMDNEGSYLIVDTDSRNLVGKITAGYLKILPGFQYAPGRKFVLIPIGLT